MCLGAAPREADPSTAMGDDSLAAVLLCRQHADRVVGIAAGRHGKVLVTIQGDGVVTYSAAQEASSQTRALGSSHAQFLAPVQQMGSSYVAAVQPQGSSAYGVLLRAPVTAQQPRPLLDAEQQLALPSKLASLHVVQPPASAAVAGSSSATAGVAAVVLADGTVAAADFKEQRLHTADAGTASAAAATTGRSKGRASSSSSTRVYAGCDGQVLVVARQSSSGDTGALIDLYTASSGSSSSSSDGNGSNAQAALQPQHPHLQLLHSMTLQPPSEGSKLTGLSVAPGLLVLLWSCQAVSVCSFRHQQQQQLAGGVLVGPVNTMQLPAQLAGILAAAAGAAAAAGVEDGHTDTPAAEKPNKRKQRSTAAAPTAAGDASWTAAALSEHHVLLLAADSSGGSTSIHYALLDSSYGSCLATGSFNAGSTPAAPGSNSSDSGKQLQLLCLPQHPFAPAALLLHGAVWLLPLQLPKADLAGLVSSMGGLSTTAAAAAAAGSTQPLVTARQNINLTAIAAAATAAPAGAPGTQQQQRQQGACVLQQLQPSQAPAAAAGAEAEAGAAANAAVTAAAQQVGQLLAQQKRPVQELQAAITQLCDTLQEQQQQQQQQAAPSSQALRQQQMQQQRQQASCAVLVSQQLLAQALSACADAQEWALLHRLSLLEPLQSLAGCPGLVPALAAAQQYDTLRQVLLAAREVPATGVVQAAGLLLQQPSLPQQQQQGDKEGPSEQQLAAAQQIRAAAEAVVQQAEAAAAAGDAAAAQQLVPAARHAAVAVDGFTSRELLLHVLLAVQIDAVEAQAELRGLPAPAVLRLLRYCTKWLRKFSRNALTAASTDPLLTTPSPSQVMEWCKHTLDAQLTKLMLMPAAAPLLQQLQALLRSEASCTRQLLGLKGVTDTWATGAPLPAAAVAAHSQYVLELLDLRVTH